MQGSLVVGDKVVTTAGMHGEVVAIGDTTVVLLVAPSVKITYEKSAILKKLSETDDRDGTDVDESHPDPQRFPSDIAAFIAFVSSVTPSPKSSQKRPCLRTGILYLWRHSPLRFDRPDRSC